MRCEELKSKGYDVKWAKQSNYYGVFVYPSGGTGGIIFLHSCYSINISMGFKSHLGYSGTVSGDAGYKKLNYDF